MNILIISAEAWRDTNNGGNVLSNIFSAFPGANIAQVYCSGEAPQNMICRQYFQISDTMLLTHQKGKKLEEKDYSMHPDSQPEVVENVIKGMIPGCLKEAALLAREFLWTILNWKTEELEQFIKEFEPDILFAPCYSYFHVSKLALHAKEIADCPMISYISDDNYSLRKARLSLFFWINRLITRKWIRRHFSASELVYTMTELQKNEYMRYLGRPMKVLCKSAEFEVRNKEIGNPIRFIYAGGLYLNRWKILGKISQVLEKINCDGIKAQLHIYSGTKLPTRHEKKLNDGRNSFLHSQISYSELMKQYRKSDVAIHAEAFDKKNHMYTRMSFSTKIIDCMNSGCAILAVGPSDQAGISYLKEHDAAVCVNALEDLYAAVSKLVSQPELIDIYAHKAVQLGKQNHSKYNTEQMLRQDFCDIVARSQI